MLGKWSAFGALRGFELDEGAALGTERTSVFLVGGLWVAQHTSLAGLK